MTGRRMRFLFLKAQVRFSVLWERYPLDSFPPFCKVSTRNVLVPRARSSPNLGLLTEAGQRLVSISHYPRPPPLLHFSVSHCVSLVTGCWRCLDTSLLRDSQYVLSLCLVY